MFTFAVITYNHEPFILEHLESIKYQIEHFGQGESFALVVSDDASKDRTIALVEKWLELNRSLFNEVEILVSERNQGIVQNYIRAVQAIKSDRFKVLAGDDLYFNQSILQELGAFDLVFTPVIEFNQKVRQSISKTNYLTMKNDSFSALRRQFGYTNFIMAPGVFIKRALAQDPGLLEFVSQFRWFEDYAKWYYIFHRHVQLSIAYDPIPKVLYRVGSGISTDRKHRRHAEFLEEYDTLVARFKPKAHRYPKYINPYRYYQQFRLLKTKYIDAHLQPELKMRVTKFKSCLSEADRHLALIRANVQKFEEKNQ